MPPPLQTARDPSLQDRRTYDPAAPEGADEDREQVVRLERERDGVVDGGQGCMYCIFTEYILLTIQTTLLFKILQDLEDFSKHVGLGLRPVILLHVWASSSSARPRSHKSGLFVPHLP